MKTNFFKTVIALSTMLLMISCGSTPEKKLPAKKVVEQPSVKSTPRPKISSGIVVKTLNKQLDKIPVMGFRAYSPTFNKKQMDFLNNRIFPAVKLAINKIPAGHIILITGHTSKVGNSNRLIPRAKYLSIRRARTVYNFLVRKGISKNKLKYQGVGSTDPAISYAPRSAKNRRVTFKVVSK